MGTNSVLRAIELVLVFAHSAWVINRQLYLLLIKHRQPSVHWQAPSAVHHRAMLQQWLHLHIQYYRHPIEWFVTQMKQTAAVGWFQPNQHSIHGCGVTLHLCYKCVSRCFSNPLHFFGVLFFIWTTLACRGWTLRQLGASGKNNSCKSCFSGEKMSLSSIPTSNWASKPCTVALLWPFPCQHIIHSWSTCVINTQAKHQF